MGDVENARATSEMLLAAPLPRRWSHVQAVAARAESIAGGLRTQDANDLVSAAWLHDVGYSPVIAHTGLHALDGARHLRRLRVPERVVNLVAFHSCGLVEARMRGLEQHLTSEFRDEDQ